MYDEYPPLAALPQLTLHPSIDPARLDAAKIVNDWLSSFTESLSQGQSDGILGHFLEQESWWRDFVSFSWDIACHNGAEAICNYLTSSAVGFAEPKADQPGALQPQLADMGGLRFIQSGFGFKTKFGTGRGVVRLANVGPDQWKAWTVFTVLEQLNGQDELFSHRAKEAEMQAGAPSQTPPASDQTDSNLQVLVVGAGQAGLAIAAHLKHLGITYLVVDKASEAGESWRDRYDTIKSHTTTFSDHYPFLKYPTNWPRYLDKERIVKWMGHYEDILGLNIKRATLASKIQYNESTQRYSIELQSKDSVQTVNPKHLILATGPFSATPIQPTFPGQDLFKGQVYHTAEHKSAALVPDVQNKRVTIIGAGTSAHDVAQDFVNHGAKTVTMVQRHPIFVTSLDANAKIQMALWNTPGLSTEDADLLGNSLPIAIVRTLSVGATQMMAAYDKVMLDGLERAGLAVKRGEQGDSLVDHQLIKTGHFYIDQGASQMIIDGRIQIRRCEEGVQGYSPEGIVLVDGTEIKSDIIILATGFERCVKAIGALMGGDVMDKVGEICAMDDSQERIGVWRPTGMPGFWYTAGSFLWSRQFSPILALQIDAIERGLNRQ